MALAQFIFEDLLEFSVFIFGRATALGIILQLYRNALSFPHGRIVVRGPGIIAQRILVGGPPLRALPSLAR